MVFDKNIEININTAAISKETGAWILTYLMPHQLFHALPVRLLCSGTVIIELYRQPSQHGTGVIKQEKQEIKGREIAEHQCGPCLCQVKRQLNETVSLSRGNNY